MYWNYRNHIKQVNEEAEYLNSIYLQKEILTLPAKLR